MPLVKENSRKNQLDLGSLRKRDGPQTKPHPMQARPELVMIKGLRLVANHRHEAGCLPDDGEDASLQQEHADSNNQNGASEL